MPDRHTRESGVAQLADTLARWPADRPLAVLIAEEGRWTLVASPVTAHAIRSPADLGALLPPGNGPAPHEAGPPFRSGRIVLLGFPLGAAFEPSSGRNPIGGEPLGWVLDCPGVLAFDSRAGVWARFGQAPDPPEPGPRAAPPAPFGVGPLTSRPGRAGYMDLVGRARRAIAAGDVYQVNLAHRLSARFEGSTRAFFAALAREAEPAHGVYAELPDGAAVCSASPELFLSYDAQTRRVVTQPMKGTRPIAGDAEELRRADKDRAELNMITDLMRNDLGRVCAFGSVRVERSREIRAHGRSVWQATSTVSGVLRAGLGAADLLAASFPPGSVTGTPKIRAMQLIEDLEPTPRGFYCGALGWVDDSGSMSLNVAIRTAVVTPGPERDLHYHAGAGIVADSDPASEWEETLAKAEVLRRAVACGSGPAAVGSVIRERQGPMGTR